MEDDIEQPMEPVLDMPVASHGGGEQLGVERHGGEVVAAFEAGCPVLIDCGFKHRDNRARVRLHRISRQLSRNSDELFAVLRIGIGPQNRPRATRGKIGVTRSRFRRAVLVPHLVDGGKAAGSWVISFHLRDDSSREWP